MKIKTKLQLSIAFTLIMIIVVPLIFHATQMKTRELEERRKLDRTIIKGVSELKSVTLDYLLYHNERSSTQWHVKFESLKRLAAERKSINPKNPELLDKVSEDLDIIRGIFIRLEKSHEFNTAGSGNVAKETENILVSQLMIRTDVFIADTFKLQESSSTEALAEELRADLLIIVFVGILALLMAANTLLLRRSILAPLLRLREGARNIAGGDMSFRVGTVGTVGNDEIGDLSHAFDEMTVKLQLSYENLKYENAERTNVAERLRETAADMQIANTELADSRRAAINLMEDALDARRKAEDSAAGLRESESRYRSLFESMLDGFAYCKMLFDEHGSPVDFVYLNVNSAFASLTGLNDVLGKKVTDVIPGIKESNPELFEIYGRVALSGQSEKFVTKVEPLGIWFSISVYSTKREHFVAVFNNITDRKRSEEALRESEERFRVLFESHKAIMLLIDPESGRIVDANASAADFYCRSREELCSMNISKINLMPADEVADQRRKAAKGDQDHFVFPHLLATGETRWVEVYSTPVLSHGTPLLFSIIHDITERREAEQERQLSMEFLHMVNESNGSDSMIRAATDFFRRNSGCEAVGIRLKDGDDYPYFESHGFPEEFIRRENFLCDCNEQGDVIRDSHGNPALECMCGNVICGRFDPSKPFFTPQGSFWSNCTTKLLASTSEADRQARTRNRCNGEGYESVALIPFGPAEAHLGLIQLNDRHIGRFTARSIALWERLASYMAAALSKFRAEEALLEAHDELAKQVEERSRELREKEVLLKEIHHRVKNNLQVISSLVGLQADGSQDETVREVLRDVTDRVRSMALVHEKLYQSADLSHINFADYARSLLNFLWRAHGAAAASVGLTFDLEPVSLPVDTAVPCGLILNELAGNALKHAFRGRAGGEVTVSLHNGEDGRISLCVSDNGIGLPEGFDLHWTKSLGLRLVQMLARQVDATVQVGGEEGTKFEIVF